MFFQSFLMVAAEMHLAVFSTRTCPATKLAPIGETAGLATVIWDQVMPQAFLADSVSIAVLRLIQKTFFLKLNYIFTSLFFVSTFFGYQCLTDVLKECLSLVINMVGFFLRTSSIEYWTK